MTEVRVSREGTLRFVQASGSGTTWATGTGAPALLFGYVSDFKITSGQKITTIKDRGNVSHHKLTEINPLNVTFKVLYTGGWATALQSSGATVPMYHGEWRASAAEIGNGTTGTFVQFYGLALESIDINEALDGDSVDYKFLALGMGAATGSGYLS